MAYRLAVQCNVIKFMMLLCITIPHYASSHEKFGVTPPSPPHPPLSAQEHQSKAACMGGSTQSLLNDIQTYAATDLFWQPIICFLSFAFSIFHAHFYLKLQQKVRH